MHPGFGQRASLNFFSLLSALVNILPTAEKCIRKACARQQKYLPSTFPRNSSCNGAEQTTQKNLHLSDDDKDDNNNREKKTHPKYYNVFSICGDDDVLTNICAFTPIFEQNAFIKEEKREE